MLEKLIKLANELDLMGLEKEANDVDAFIRRLSKMVKFASDCENHDDDNIVVFEEDMDTDNKEYPDLEDNSND
jgi:hypothetical protein